MDYRLKKHKVAGNTCNSFVLGADVGGTNTKIGIAGINKIKNKPGKPELLLSFHFSSRKLRSIIPALKTVLNYAKKNKMEIKKACIAGAGPVSNGRCRLTNLKWNINAKEIKKRTGLKAKIINDFAAIGYFMNILSKKDIIILKKGRPSKAKKLIIGAGTGLGIAAAVYKKNRYIPIPSEHGHDVFPSLAKDTQLFDFIRKKRKIKKVTYEDILSGRGIEGIYCYVKSRKGFPQTRYAGIIGRSKEKTMLISKYRKVDKSCRETFRLYTEYYARSIRHFALALSPRGGVYIAGGIAQKNRGIFRQKEFKEAFKSKTGSKSPKMQRLLKNMPISLIINNDAGLYGALWSIMKRQACY